MYPLGALADLIRHERKRLNYRVMDFARKVQVTSNTVVNWEKRSYDEASALKVVDKFRHIIPTIIIFTDSCMIWDGNTPKKAKVLNDQPVDHG